MKLSNNTDPYGLRNGQGRWVRKGVNKTKIAIALAVIGTFFYCAPRAWKYDQGSMKFDQSVAEAFLSGKCKYVDPIEGVRGSTIVCSYSDKEILKKWSESMEKQVDFWKEQADQPMAILKRVCRNENLIDSDCPKILYAMALQESRFGKAMIGDGGRSEGWFHILDIHQNVTKACKYDLECSAKFTLARMIRYGFKTDRNNAIMAHNGTPGIPATLAYLQAIKKKMPLAQ